MSGTFKNISLLKTRDPGELPRVVCTLHLSACCAIDKASSTKSLACLVPLGGLSCTSVLKTFPTVWCIRSQTALAVGLQLVVGTSLMLDRSKSFWNFHPVNLPPLS